MLLKFEDFHFYIVGEKFHAVFINIFQLNKHRT